MDYSLIKAKAIYLGRSEVPVIREEIHESVEMVNRNKPGNCVERAIRHAAKSNAQRH